MNNPDFWQMFFAVLAANLLTVTFAAGLMAARKPAEQVSWPALGALLMPLGFAGLGLFIFG